MAVHLCPAAAELGRWPFKPCSEAARWQADAPPQQFDAGPEGLDPDMRSDARMPRRAFATTRAQRRLDVIGQLNERNGRGGGAIFAMG